MSKTRLGSPKYQVQCAIDSMLAIGESKHWAKVSNGGKPPVGKIFSYSTASTYLNCNIRFFHWCRDRYGCREFSECQPYIEEFLYECYIKIGRSAWTTWKNASAICKPFSLTTTDLKTELPARRREDIRKNRSINIIYHDDNQPNWVRFCLATGLRICELRRLTVDDVYQRADGKVVVYVRRGKGGRYRHVIALNNYPLILMQLAETNGQTNILEKIPHNAQTHYYRHQFAQALYKQVARPTNTLLRSERYYCRRDMKGLVLDRKAMLIVSHALGHNRIGVTTTYLQGIDLNN